MSDLGLVVGVMATLLAVAVVFALVAVGVIVKATGWMVDQGW